VDDISPAQNGLATAAPAVDLGDLRRRFAAIRDAMLRTYVERDDAVECIMLSALCQQHPLLLGPPGTGKSHLIGALTRCISGARYFSTLLTKFSTEDEVCGPAKLSALKQDRFERSTDGHLPGCEVAFLDETFKANSAVLNSTLSVLNERTYKGKPSPLRMACGASNEMPEDETLGALFDRFLLRYVVSYVESPHAWKGMLKARPSFTPPATITVAEWDAVTRAVTAVVIPDAIYDELERLKALLTRDGVVVSDRRWIQLCGVLQAAAWLDGAPEVEKDHLYALRFGLWSKQAEIGPVEATLKTVDLGPAREALDIIDDALRAYEARPTDPAAYYAAIPTLMTTLATAGKRVQQYAGKLTRRAHEKVERKVAALKAANQQLKEDLVSQRYSGMP